MEEHQRRRAHVDLAVNQRLAPAQPREDCRERLEVAVLEVAGRVHDGVDAAEVADKITPFYMDFGRNGTINRTGVLLVICLCAGDYAWTHALSCAPGRPMKHE